MNERRTVPLSTLTAAIAWAVAISIAIASIAVGFTNNPGLTLALQTLAFVSVGLSVCLTVRCYAFRVMRLIRTLEGDRIPDSPASIHSLT